MSAKTPVHTDTVKKSTMMTVAVMCLGIGFLGGVVYSAFTASPQHTPHGVTQDRPANPDLTEKIAAWAEETKRNPANTSAWIQLGNLYFDTDQIDNAIEAYRRALQLDDNNANVWTDLGVMYRRGGQPEKAVASFDAAMQADPQHEVSRFNKGIVLMHDLNDPQGAIAAWEDLLTVNPFAMAPNGQSMDSLINQFKKQLTAQPPQAQ
jgi:cytochrome c-type biogenesis protein CcmH/NrfG